MTQGLPRHYELAICRAAASPLPIQTAVFGAAVPVARATRTIGAAGISVSLSPAKSPTKSRLYQSSISNAWATASASAQSGCLVDVGEWRYAAARA